MFKRSRALLKNSICFAGKFYIKQQSLFFFFSSNNIHYKVFRAGSGEEQGDREETEPSNTFPSCTLSVELNFDFM